MCSIFIDKLYIYIYIYIYLSNFIICFKKFIETCKGNHAIMNNRDIIIIIHMVFDDISSFQKQITLSSFNV